jgi:hypothetical protein
MALQEVEYRPIPGFPGYRVGSDGTVWGNRKPGPGEYQFERWSLRKPHSKSGYLWVTLSRAGKAFGKAVHYLVLEAFVGPRLPGSVGCHNNGIKPDNRLENLRWDTPRANACDTNQHGHRPDQKGEKNPFAKLTGLQVLEIRRLHAEGESLSQLAARFGLHKVYVSQICRRKRWVHV